MGRWKYIYGCKEQAFRTKATKLELLKCVWIYLYIHQPIIDSVNVKKINKTHHASSYSLRSFNFMSRRHLYILLLHIMYIFEIQFTVKSYIIITIVWGEFIRWFYFLFSMTKSSELCVPFDGNMYTFIILSICIRSNIHFIWCEYGNSTNAITILLIIAWIQHIRLYIYVHKSDQFTTLILSLSEILMVKLHILTNREFNALLWFE